MRKLHEINKQEYAISNSVFDSKNRMRIVGIGEMDGEITYPANAPFNPPENYPEYPFKEIDTSNTVYPLVRALLLEMGLDKEHFGTPTWNPLKQYIKRGAKVIIKPNWVFDISQYDINALITHMSVIRPILDYAFLACGKKGRIDILESPIENTDWDRLHSITKAPETVAFLKKKGVTITLQDIRTECFVEKDVFNILGWRLKFFYRKKRPGTKRGYVNIDIGKKSALHDIGNKVHMMRGIQHWAAKDVQNAHSETRHLYKIPKEILEADCFINIPKLKTHRKAGVTLTLKNLVGMADKKVWLPHFIEGTPQDGGDEAPSKRQWHVKLIDELSIIHFFKKFGFSFRPPGVEKLWRKKIEEDLLELRNVRQANWHGGDTVWRMVYDLNMILFHADEKGKLHSKQQRNYFSIIDGVISGEKFGPLDSVPKKTGVVIAGDDPVLVELIGTRLMGFDENKIKTITNVSKAAYSFGSANLSDVTIASNKEKWKQLLTTPKSVAFTFIPAPGWQGHIEL